MTQRITMGDRERPSVERGRPAPLQHQDMITSRDNKWLKMFRAALRGTGPDRDAPIGVEGPKLIEDAVRSGLAANALLVSVAGERELERIFDTSTESDTGIPRSRILRTTDKLFASVTGTEAPQGVAALFQQRAWTFDDVLRGPGAMRQSEPLVVVMVGVQDPGNVGTIVRSAEAFGATGVVATRGTADPWSPKALRASAGSALRLPTMRGIALSVILTQLKMARLKCIALESASHHLAKEVGEVQADFREPIAIFVGSEGAGLPLEVLHAADATISIPVTAAIESLNAGVAASVILFEVSRQRKPR